MRKYQSWGGYSNAQHEIETLAWRHHPLRLDSHNGKSFLPYGNGRSYGDVCLNDNNVLIDTHALNRFLYFDKEKGILCCESGVLLSEILDLIIPHGWFLSVTPGTQFVTIGGAIANDVHGKNHHQAGTFGCHVNQFELLRSDGSRLQCSKSENTQWFSATIGGLGLTGIITWAEIQLKSITNAYIDQEVIKFPGLSSFFQLSVASDKEYQYTVAWVDCSARGKQLGRGIFLRGNHSSQAITKKSELKKSELKKSSLTFPVQPPISLVNKLSLKILNTLYYHRQSNSQKNETVYYAPFFYPLDKIQYWNRAYGRKGFFQYQCVVSMDDGEQAIRQMLERISKVKLGSFLTVLKIFGNVTSPGLLSFPKPGVTLALDFPNQGNKTFVLLDELDDITREAGGAVYPAKDARMNSENFKHYYPQWEKLIPFIDEKFSSSFWRRVTGR